MQKMYWFHWVIVGMFLMILAMFGIILYLLGGMPREHEVVTITVADQNSDSEVVPPMIRTQESYQVTNSSTQTSSDLNVGDGHANSPVTNVNQFGNTTESTTDENTSFSENVPAVVQTRPIVRREWTHEEIQALIQSRRSRGYPIQWRDYDSSVSSEHFENQPIMEPEEGGLFTRVRLEFLELVTDENTGEQSQFRIYPSRIYVGPGLETDWSDPTDPVIMVKDGQSLWFRPIFHGHGIQEIVPGTEDFTPPIMTVPDIPFTFSVLVIYEPLPGTSMYQSGELLRFELTHAHLYNDRRHDRFNSPEFEYYDGYKIKWESFLQNTPIACD